MFSKAPQILRLGLSLHQRRPWHCHQGATHFELWNSHYQPPTSASWRHVCLPMALLRSALKLLLIISKADYVSRFWVVPCLTFDVKRGKSDAWRLCKRRFVRVVVVAVLLTSTSGKTNAGARLITPSKHHSLYITRNSGKQTTVSMLRCFSRVLQPLSGSDEVNPYLVSSGHGNEEQVIGFTSCENNLTSFRSKWVSDHEEVVLYRDFSQVWRPTVSWSLALSQSSLLQDRDLELRSQQSCARCEFASRSGDDKNYFQSGTNRSEGRTSRIAWFSVSQT